MTSGGSDLLRTASRPNAARLAVWGSMLGAGLWLVSLVGAPYLVTHHRGSRMAVMVAAGPYAMGRLICHQRAERSFHMWDVQLPVCARCLGLYAAAPLGFVWPLAAVRRGRGRRSAAWRGPVLMAAAPTAVAVALEWLGIASPDAWVRAVAALPLGAVAAGAVGSAWAERFEA